MLKFSMAHYIRLALLCQKMARAWMGLGGVERATSFLRPPILSDPPSPGAGGTGVSNGAHRPDLVLMDAESARVIKK